MTATKKSNASASPLEGVLSSLRGLHKKELENRLTSVEELVWAVMTDHGIDEDEAAEKIRKLRDTFVDWNEVRVARTMEVARPLDPIEDAPEVALRIREVLGRLFDRSGRITFSFLQGMKVAEARRAIAEIEPVPRAVSDRILMMETESAMLPFSGDAVKLAKKLKLIGRNHNRQHLNKLFDESLPRKDAIDLYFLIETHLQAGCTKSKCPVCKNAK